MSGGDIFVSHATADDPTVAEIRRRLEARGLAVWAGLAHVVGAGGQVLVRFAWQNLPLQ